MCLEAKASPDYSAGACLVHAASVQDLETLRMLVPFSCEKASLGNALAVFLDSEKLMASAGGVATVEFLLVSGAVGRRHAAAFIQTARNLNAPALKALTGPEVPTDTVNTALKEVSGVDQRWFSPEGLPVVQHLLRLWCQRIRGR